MRKFDYSFLNNGLLPANLVNLTSNIAALKTMAGVRKEEYTQIFTELEAVAKVQSIKSSNAIEGIVTSDERIAAIVNQNSAPLNHNEAEIAGYRDALNEIHLGYEYIDFRQSDILRLHEMMMSFAGYEYGGQYKTDDNVILEIDADGNRRVRFRPTPASETPKAMEQLELAYLDARSDANINQLLLIPCVIVIAGSLMKKPTIPVMIISSAVAVVIAMAIQGFSFSDCAASMVSGFKMEMLHTSVDLENIVEQIPNLLQRGGMSSMMNTALMAFCGFSFIGALTVCGSMELILERIMKHIHGTGQLITLTVALGVVMITVIGEATVTFLMIGGMFRPEYIKRGLESKNLSRSLEDSITVVEPLVPWSLAGVYMTSVLGVPTVQYAPWAVLCYTGVFFAILWGFTGFGIKKITKDSPAYEEYLQLSGKSAEE